MTGLGATIYGGFFGLAALWLFLTADRAEAPQGADQPNEPVRSNSINTGRRAGGIELVVGEPVVGEVGLGIAVAAVGEQRDH